MQQKKEVVFSISKCKTKAAMSVKPAKKIHLDLDSIRKNFKVVLDTDMLLVIKEDDEIIVHSYGELLFKTMTDKDKIEQISKRIYEVAA